MPDLRRSFRRITRQYGHHVLLRRRRTDTNEALYEMGYKKCLVRNMHPSSVGLARSAQEVREGLIANVDVVYWFEWDDNPRQGDLIYDRDPRGVLRFEIDYSHPLRGKNGRIEFWACGCTKTSEPYQERGPGVTWPPGLKPGGRL